MNKSVSPEAFITDINHYGKAVDSDVGIKERSVSANNTRGRQEKIVVSRSSLRRRQIVRSIVKHHDLLARAQFDPVRRSRQRALADLYRRLLGDNGDAALDNSRMASRTVELRANLAALMSLAPDRNFAEALDMTLRTLREETLALRAQVEKIEARLLLAGVIGPEIAH